MPKSRKAPSRKISCLKGEVESVDPSQNPLADSDWQFLSELELRVVDNAEHLVHAWLTECLKSLDLREDFMKRVLRSAQGAIRRSARSESGLQFESIHIILFIPPTHGLGGQAWGFFRVEKPGETVQDAVSPGQTIALYLYPEGQ